MTQESPLRTPCGVRLQGLAASAHGVSLKCEGVNVVHQPLQDGVGDGGIAGVPVSVGGR
jgi:hypothetical protein